MVPRSTSPYLSSVGNANTVPVLLLLSLLCHFFLSLHRAPVSTSCLKGLNNMNRADGKARDNV